MEIFSLASGKNCGEALVASQSNTFAFVSFNNNFKHRLINLEGSVVWSRSHGRLKVSD